MAEVELKVGAKLDLLNKHELKDALSEAAQIEYERLRGVKKMRIPMVTGTAVNSAITLGGHTGDGLLASPEQGFVWSIRHLVIEGMTASSSTPDVMNIKRNDRIIWQLNGNQFAQTWGHGEIMLNPGEALAYASVGTFASMSLIIVHGTADQVPAELVAKIA